MATPVAKSDTPFQTGGSIKVFPEQKLNKLLIRIESGGTFKVHITVDGIDPSSTHANIFLDSGDAIELNERYYGVSNGNQVRILSVTGDPKIFWHMH